MRESQYTSSVSGLLPEDVYALKLSLPYTAGVPDSYYSGIGGDNWIEWKYLKSVPRTVDLVSGNKPIITKLQQQWLERRHDEGRNVGVIVGSPNGGVIYPGLSWQQVLTREEFLSRCVSKKEQALWIASRCRPH